MIYTSGKELLRKLGGEDVDFMHDRLEIPNLTFEIVETLQCIVDSQHEPYRKAFKVYFITVALSSLVYRRGLIGLDLDELKIYVNDEDYFPPHFRYYKSATRDEHHRWQGWRRLWIRGETVNRPDGPKIIELAPAENELAPLDRQTIVLFDHRNSGARVKLPDLDSVISQFGLGKSKDRVRDALLDRWSTFSDQQRGLLCRLHAAAAAKMLFDLPSELFLTRTELQSLAAMTETAFLGVMTAPKPLLSLDGTSTSIDSEGVGGNQLVARPHWIDAIKYPVRIFIRD